MSLLSGFLPQRGLSLEAEVSVVVLSSWQKGLPPAEGVEVAKNGMRYEVSGIT